MTKPTAQTIVEAALETIKAEGFAGASSRAIARQGGFNQALVFYCFGSLEGLLLAAVERASEERLARYRPAVADVQTLEVLIPVVAELWAPDQGAGHGRG